MKKIIIVAFFSVFVLALVGCETEKDRMDMIRSESKSERENSLKEESISREAEIEEVDKWGVSLDDVDRLAKQAIRKHENVSDYKRDYNKAIRETDKFLEDVEHQPDRQHDLESFIEKYKESCYAGIEYIEASVDVELLYNLFQTDDEFDKTEKDLIRTFLTVNNPSILDIEQSISDMEVLLKPVIEEDRELTDDELEKIYEIYQVLIDKVYAAG